MVSNIISFNGWFLTWEWIYLKKMTSPCHITSPDKNIFTKQNNYHMISCFVMFIKALNWMNRLE